MAQGIEVVETTPFFIVINVFFILLLKKEMAVISRFCIPKAYLVKPFCALKYT